MIGENIKKARKAKGIKQNELADMVEITKGAMSKIESGANIPTITTVKTIANVLGISLDIILNDNVKQVAKIPIVGEASCGLPISNNHQGDNQFCNYSGEHYNHNLYCVIASGDSMSPEIEDGDEIICDPTVKPIHGDLVHYVINNESAIKLYVVDEEANIVQFVPYNPDNNFKTKTIRLDDDEAKNLSIAKVVSVNKLKFNNRLARLKIVGRA